MDLEFVYRWLIFVENSKSMIIKIKNESLYNIRRDIGVYILRCIPLNRIYIGSTNQSFRARFNNHCKFLKRGTLGNKTLQQDYNLYGPENFEFEILGIYPEHLTVKYETYFKDTLHPYYNIRKPCNNSKTNQGRKFTEEHKEKIREKSKLFKHSDIERISEQNKNGATKFVLINQTTGEEKFIQSRLDLEKFFGVTYVNRFYNKIYKGWLIKVMRTQRKSVKLLVYGRWETFSSYEKCDKFLNKWRGYTSTQSLRKVNTLDGYNVIFE